MATTTTNYGFDIPQSTDLVKDGATAIATLGQDIDTAMNTALGTKKAGMVLLNTTSFSGVSSVSLPAGTFSSTYDNYRVIINVDTTSSGTTANLRFRASGSDNSSSNYAYNHRYLTTANTTYTQGNANTTTNFRIGFSDGGTDMIIIDVFNPMRAFRTGYMSYALGKDGANFATERNSGQMTVTTAYDSLTFIQNSMTGTIRAYGYNN